MKIQKFLIDAEVPFLGVKGILEGWNFKINGQNMVQEIESRKNGLRMTIKMIDTAGGYYAVILKTKKKQDSNILYLDDTDLGILFLEDEEGGLCSFKAVKKIHKVNCHKSKEQLFKTLFISLVSEIVASLFFFDICRVVK